MKKGILAGILSAALVAGSAVTAFAGTVSDIDCTGWWVAHSEAAEIADGATVTYNFKSTTYADATANWDGPIYVLYSADAAFAGGAGIKETAGYSEIFVCRGDLYGWTPSANTNDGLGDGYSFVRDTEPDWDAFLTTEKAGAEGTVTASRDGSTVTVVMDFAGAKSTFTYTAASGTVYLSLGGELCTLTDMSYTSTSAADTTADDTTATDSTSGDALPFAVAALGLSALAAGAVVATKKFSFER